MVRPSLFDLLPRDAGGVQIKAELGALHGMREFAQGRIDPDPGAAVAETKQMHMAIPEIIGAQVGENLLSQRVVSQGGWQYRGPAGVEQPWPTLATGEPHPPQGGKKVAPAHGERACYSASGMPAPAGV